jgi:uncharacterized membrane protein
MSEMKSPPDPGNDAGGPHGPPVPTHFDRETHPTEFGRLLALSDGVFAIALTLLVLDLALPVATDETPLRDALSDQGSHFLAFTISVLLVGAAWWGHHRLFALLRGIDGSLVALNFGYLGLVALIPFVQGVLASYPREPLAYVVFAAVFAAINTVDSLMYRYAFPRRLLHERLSRRAYRVELLWGGLSIAVFVGSMPLAYILGPFTIALWVAFMPVSFAIASIQAGGSLRRPRLRRRQAAPESVDTVPEPPQESG